MAGKGGKRWNPVGSLNPAFKGGLVADRAWFIAHYVDKKLSLRQVAKAAGCSLRTAARWAKVHGVETRSMSEGRRLNPLCGPANHKWKGPKLCPCGAKRSRAAAHCMKCRNILFAGAGNPNWKGIADIMALVREHTKVAWLPAVFARDGYACVKCGDDRGGNLTGHHIHRLEALVSEIIDGLPLNTPEDRLAAVERVKSDPRVNDVANGATLCEDCHVAIHRGKRSVVVPVE